MVNRIDLLAGVVTAAAAAFVLALGDNELLPSAVAVVSCGAIVTVWFTTVRRLTARGVIDHLAYSRWMYATVPIWALAGGAATLLVTRTLLDLETAIQIAAWIGGALAGAAIRTTELRDRLAGVTGPRPEQFEQPPPRGRPESGAR